MHISPSCRKDFGKSAAASTAPICECTLEPESMEQAWIVASNARCWYLCGQVASRVRWGSGPESYSRRCVVLRYRMEQRPFAHYHVWKVALARILLNAQLPQPYNMFPSSVLSCAVTSCTASQALHAMLNRCKTHSFCDTPSSTACIQCCDHHSVGFLAVHIQLRHAFSHVTEYMFCRFRGRRSTLDMVGGLRGALISWRVQWTVALFRGRRSTLWTSKCTFRGKCNTLYWSRFRSRCNYVVFTIVYQRFGNKQNSNYFK